MGEEEVSVRLEPAERCGWIVGSLCRGFFYNCRITHITDRSTDRKAKKKLCRCMGHACMIGDDGHMGCGDRNI